MVPNLDSLNSTILNGSAICALSPVELHNGNIVKIGELTSINVSIEAALKHNVSLWRNPKKHQGKVELASIGENGELGLRFGGELGNAVAMKN